MLLPVLEAGTKKKEIKSREDRTIYGFKPARLGEVCMTEFKITPKPIEETDPPEVKMAKYQLFTLNMIDEAIKKSFKETND